MFIHHQNKTRPNYLIEGVAMTVIALCIGINLFSDNLGLTTLNARSADGFGGFKMVNTSYHHRSPAN